MCGTCLNQLSNGFCQTVHCLHENMKVPSVDIVEIVTFNISEQLKFLMNKNMKIIRKYQNQARNLATPDANDIVCAEMYQTFLKRFDELFVSLMIHADGVPLYKSKNYNAWPILGAMLELPPFARTKAENILLFGIWLGKQKPKFEMIFNELTDQLSAIKNVGIENGNEECVKVILPMLMGDMPALSTMVNFVEPASFYACMFCETKGIYNHDGHCIVYPYDRDVNLRTAADFKIRSELAASTSGRLNRERTVGHKGISVFQRILDVPLPHAIVIDAMHTVFLCHGKKILVRLQYLISKENMIKLSKKLVSIRYIHDILRRPRSFLNVQKWKASEVRVFILYIGLPALVESLSDDDAGDLAMYVVILRFLHDHWNQSEHVKSIVSNLLTIYMKNIIRKIDLNIHPPKFATISTHTHLHLPAQCTKFGRLEWLSNFVFEGFLGYLKGFVKGSSGAADQIAFGFFSNFFIKKIVHSPTQYGDLYIDDNTYGMNMFKFDEDDSLKTLLTNHLCISDATIFFSRLHRSNITFHSEMYNRKKTTCSYLVSYDMSDSIRYGFILCFIFNGAECLFAARKLKKSDRSLTSFFSTFKYASVIKDLVDELYIVVDIAEPRDFDFTNVDICPIDCLRSRCISVPLKDNLMAITEYNCAYEPN